MTSAVLFHCTVLEFVKPDPFTVSTKLGEPGVALDGLNDEIVGPVGVAMVKVSAFEEPALVVFTVMVAVPAEAMRLEAMPAVNCDALT